MKKICKKGRLIIVMLTLFQLAACSMPLKVNKIDSTNDVAKGIRYVIKRPSYLVAIRLKDDNILNMNTSHKLKPRAFPALEKQAENCFVSFLAKTDPKTHKKLILNFDVVLKQNMDGGKNIYEITTPNGFSALPHILSDTDLTITTEANAELKSISAGETDKSLEFIQAVAGLAISAVTPATPLKYCTVFARDKFKKYLSSHLSLLKRKKLNSSRLKELENSLGSEPIHELVKSTKAISFLREELKAIQLELKGTYYILNGKKDYTLSVGGKNINPNPSSPWININLTN